MNKVLLVVVGIVGVLLLIVAGFYFLEPAKSLPSFFPGHTLGLATYHYKHGIGAVVLALAAFAFIWFESGKKSAE